VALSDFETLGELWAHQARRFGGKTAFINVDGGAISFAAFDRRVNRLNGALAARGLAKGDRVAVLSRNRTEVAEVFGTAKTGLITVPLNWRLTAGELHRLLIHSQPGVVIADEEHASRLQMIDAAGGGALRVVFGPARDGWMAYEQLLGEGDPAQPRAAAPLRGDEPICLMYTSGTTGAPKGVAITHRGALENARMAAEAVLGLRPEDRTLAVMPLFHAGGMWYHCHPSFATGCTTAIMAAFDPARVLGHCARYRLTNVHLVPTMIGALLESPALGTADLSSLRLVFYAASSIPLDLLRRAMRAFKGCRFVQSYGSTEAGVVTGLSPDDHLRGVEPANERLLFSCGRPVGDVRVRIIGEDGGEVPPGAIGEIEVAGAGMMGGYWNDPAATAGTLDHGWLRSGDLGYRDHAGYLFLVDRKNDKIVTGGENVYPSEVEEVLYREPEILQAAVFGVPDPVWVEKVVAAVVLRPGCTATPAEIIGRARQHLAGYKCPKEIFVRQELPMSAVGKVLKTELRRSVGAA